MLTWLKEARYRRKFGPERAANILELERRIATLPREFAASDWIEWLWDLPEEAWREAVAIRGDQAALPSTREEAVQAITRKSRLVTKVDDAATEEERL